MSKKGWCTPVVLFVLVRECFANVIDTDPDSPGIIGSGPSQRRLDDSLHRMKWPEEYQLSWQIDIPYIRELQKDGLQYQYQGWQDTRNGRQKTTRDGVESVIEFLDNNTQYQIYPRIDTWGCRTLEIAGGKGPTRKLLEDEKPKLTLVLPNLNEGRWHYNRSGPVEEGPHKGLQAHVYSYTVKHDEGYGETAATYIFYVSQDGTPLRLYMWGKNLYTGGHFDAYVVDYYDYKPGPIPDSIWEVPAICPKEPEPENRAAQHSHWLAKLRSVLPNLHYGDDVYDVFAHMWGRRHSSTAEYSSRKQHFYRNKDDIERHNQEASNHILGVNQFADWSHEEFLAVMLPNMGQPRPPLWPEGQKPNTHKSSIQFDMLPKTVDWRGTPADSPVKDQAMCGSCWAFGTIGSLETAYYRMTGHQKLLSEQELMDCAWDAKDENKGCMGGFQSLAFQWLFPAGKLASEEAYPYKGVTDFCRKNHTSGIHFKNARYVEVKGGEKALMEAIYTKGPMTVSVDAAPHSFAFYQSGVYTEETCHSKLDKLDHAVIVSGYGTTDDGQDYWLVKNTWSANWGDDGYLKIARQPHDCGIATQPLYVEFDVEEPTNDA